jgi:hypothetical protein
VSEKANTPSGSENPLNFTDEEIARFYRAKWLIARCEICQVSDWAVDPGIPLSAIPAAGRTEDISLAGPMTVHYRIVCASCGNTKLLMASVIRRWLDANS